MRKRRDKEMKKKETVCIKKVEKNKKREKVKTLNPSICSKLSSREKIYDNMEKLDGIFYHVIENKKEKKRNGIYE